MGDFSSVEVDAVVRNTVKSQEQRNGGASITHILLGQTIAIKETMSREKYGVFNIRGVALGLSANWFYIFQSSVRIQCCFLIVVTLM